MLHNYCYLFKKVGKGFIYNRKGLKVYSIYNTMYYVRPGYSPLKIDYTTLNKLIEQNTLFN